MLAVDKRGCCDQQATKYGIGSSALSSVPADDIARLLKVSRNTVNHQSILRGKPGPPRNCFGPTCVDCSSGGRRRP